MTEYIGGAPFAAVARGFAPDGRLEHEFNPGSIEWLLRAVERHAMAEGNALDKYEALATASGDPVIALVMRLLLEDEDRHHGLLKRIEASLRDAIDWTESPDALPACGNPQQPLVPGLVETAQALIEEEHEGARELRQLARFEKRIDGELHSLLLETMALDSEKHARMLQFVRDRLVARARAADGPSD